MGVQIGRWDCQYCGYVGNSGPETKCSQCAAPRDPDVKFYLPEDAEYVEDEEIIRQASLGADWHCDHCGADNKAADEQCRSCGDPRTEADGTRQEKTHSLSEVPHSDSDTRREPSDDMQATPPLSESRSKIRKNLKGILLAAAAIIGILIFLFWPRETTVTVSGHSWERTIAIEAYRKLREKAWQLPSRAELVRSFQAIHHYEKVLDHYETRTRTVQVKVGEDRYVCGKTDRGNGYFTNKYCTRARYESRQESYQEPIYRDEPVYQTRYEYMIWRWVLDRTNRADGASKNPKWPKGPPEGEHWRAGKKTQVYVLHVTDKKGKRHKEEVNFNVWKKYDADDEMKAKTNMVGMLSLMPE